MQTNTVDYYKKPTTVADNRGHYYTLLPANEISQWETYMRQIS